jgi:hypothetical protein
LQAGDGLVDAVAEVVAFEDGAEGVDRALGAARRGVGLRLRGVGLCLGLVGLGRGLVGLGVGLRRALLGLGLVLLGLVDVALDWALVSFSAARSELTSSPIRTVA